MNSYLEKSYKRSHIAMVFYQAMYVHLLTWIFTIVLVANSCAAVPQPRSDCQTTCGNLTIPFPFGTSPECYLDETFFISCNATTNYTAILRNSNRKVFNISLDGQLRVSVPIVAHLCDNDNSSTPLSQPPNLRISSTMNSFTVVGCDILGTWWVSTREKSYGAACFSQCDNTTAVTNGSCLGVGCCQISLPEGVTKSQAWLSVQTPGQFSSADGLGSCSYAFIAEKEYYNFSLGDLFNIKKTEMPVVLDWVVGDLSCNASKTNESSYACKAAYSECIDTTTMRGYNCNCTRGFTGNPYLIDGCQDINECDVKNACPHGSECRNIPGNYICDCPNGYEEVGQSTCRKIDRKGTLIRISSGIGSGFGFILLVLAIWLIYKQIKRRRKLKFRQIFFKRNGGLLLKQEISARKEGHVEKTKLFTAKELDKATDHYNKSRILGHGGQGTVYKGMLDDGRIVAVKMSKKVNEGNLQQFINEVVILSQLNHRNIVKLHGCCLETEVPHLVYEYIPNGTLSHYIRHDNEEFPLTWSVRLRIATEAASALSYLHISATVPIYHRDIKSDNILLDDKYRAKLADFGTSRSIAIDQTHLTTQVHGTFGYLDPEYFQTSQFTEKSDVYSFGVVLLQLLTGKKAITLTSGEGHSLVTNFLDLMEEDRLFEILDAQVINGGSKDDIKRVANLAMRSLNLNSKQRPTMNEVARELELISISNGECDIIKPKYEEVVYPIDEVDGPWELSQISTTIFEGNSVTSSSAVQPFLRHIM